MALAASDDPRALRMLVRANDWVPPVRQAAAQAVLAWLNERRLDGWRQAMPALLRLRQARRVDHHRLPHPRRARLHPRVVTRLLLVEQVRRPRRRAHRFDAARVARSDREGFGTAVPAG